MSKPVSDYLASRGRHVEASQVLIDYAADVDEAVDVLCRGAEFAEAYRLVSGSEHAVCSAEDQLTPGVTPRPPRAGRPLCPAYACRGADRIAGGLGAGRGF